ncbi:hypothetical protein PRIPAC_92403 [Pristionchus pacificus]|uniref:Uncharacterized protein n=1 Tax=Pristionchus pacificus TaxID=54126 RepID=A0A2A6BAR2_PRIPA|nr:hypothetical protein PRIPAC_92403 [Pristionchus pacificus]|eukprot:PDM62957.1 hypothetical protein PRIPAC_50172 [Pristionchus pacificus]
MLRPLFFLLLFTPLLSSLRFGTIQVAPFTMRKDVCLLDNGKKECARNNAYEGFCVQLMKLMAKEMDTEYKIEIRKGPGKIRPNGKWDGLVQDLNESHIDVAIAPIPITSNRKELLDFSPSFYTSGISMMIKKPGPNGTIYSLNPYAPVTWIAIFVLEIMSIFTVIGLYCHMRLDISDREGRWRYYILVSFILVWVICNFSLLISILHHICTTAAVNSKAEPIEYFESVQEVVEQEEIKYGLQRGSLTEEMFKNSNESMYQEMMEVMEKNGEESFVDYYNHGIQKVRGDGKEEGNYIFILDDASNLYENAKMPCNTRKIGGKLMTYEFAVATKKGSDLSDRVYAAIESLKKSGEIEKIRRHWFEERALCGKGGLVRDQRSIFRRSQYAQMGEISAAESNASYIIYGMIGGIAMSILVAILISHVERKRMERPTKYTDEVTPMNA